jgi:hypothetical protein
MIVVREGEAPAELRRTRVLLRIADRQETLRPGRPTTHGTRCGALLLAWLFSGCYPPQVPPQDDGRGVADVFLEQLRNGEVDAAWESTTADFKSDEGRESFRSLVQAQPVLREPAEFVVFQEVSLHGLKRGECTYRAGPISAGPGKEIRVIIANENGSWKVEQLVVQ